MDSRFITQGDLTLAPSHDPAEAAIATEIAREMIGRTTDAEWIGRSVRQAIVAYRRQEAEQSSPPRYDCSAGGHLLAMMPNEHDGWLREQCIGCGTIQYSKAGYVGFGVKPPV